MEKKALACDPIDLNDFMKICCSGKLPPRVAALLERCQKDPALRASLCAADILGALEPAAATRPGACDPVIHYTRQVTVPVAEAANRPSEVLIASFCAPTNRALVIDKCRVSPGNAVAAAQPETQPVMRLAKLSPFDALCLPFEPPQKAGAFVNVEHLILPSEAGFTLHVQNWNLAAEAIYDIEIKLWASC
jgi:hypothetical protein